MLIRRLIFIGFAFVTFHTAAADNAAQQAPQTTPQRVLFVGNSFSYFNNGLHNHVSSLIKAAGKWQTGTNRYRLKTLSGGRLAEHVDGFSSLIKQPTGREWDVVVIQGHSSEPVEPKRQAGFIRAANELIKQVRQHKATPVLFMTWGYAGQPEMAQMLADNYVQLGNAQNALVVPVGLAFAQSARQHPEINLYSPDVSGFDEAGNTIYDATIKHPSLAGTYLAACMFYATFYQQSPLGLAYTAGLDKSTAETLQRQAWQTYTQFYGEAK